MDINKSMPIGVFDSGFGGLTVLKQLIKNLPNENYIYIGDNANIPYGSKSNEQILNLTNKMVDFLINKKCKMIVIACNTITASAYDTLKDKYDIPIMEVISNGARGAFKATENKKVSILATEFTVNSKAYLKKINEYDNNINITQVACKELCTLIENNWNTQDNRLEILKEYVDAIDKDCDTIVLGCTHYPLVLDDIKNLLKGYNIKHIVDPAYNTSISVKEYLEKNNLLNTNNNSPKINVYSTGKMEKVKPLADIFLPRDVYTNYTLEEVTL